MIKRINPIREEEVHFENSVVMGAKICRWVRNRTVITASVTAAAASLQIATRIIIVVKDFSKTSLLVFNHFTELLDLSLRSVIAWKNVTGFLLFGKSLR
ncbi:MAG: hypothetical protein MRK02_08630 [Candidatus Scalindua sp.]|nr:hypothetical protein [Candidatus Scalindua sp.]